MITMTKCHSNKEIVNPSIKSAMKRNIVFSHTEMRAEYYYEVVFRQKNIQDCVLAESGPEITLVNNVIDD